MDEKLYLLVLKFLNFRPRSEKEVRDYLKKAIARRPGKFERTHVRPGNDSGQARMTEDDRSVIDVIIHKLKQQRFLNDEEFAKWLVRSRTDYKPKGKYLVRLELIKKGIAKEIVEQILESKEHRAKSEEELAREVLKIKKKKYDQMEPQERFAKAGSMLARRGFGLDVIKQAIDEVFGKMV